MLINSIINSDILLTLPQQQILTNSIVTQCNDINNYQCKSIIIFDSLLKSTYKISQYEKFKNP